MNKYTLGIDIGSTTVKIAILDENDTLLFADYQRHFANIQETLAELLEKAYEKLGELTLHPVITGSGGLTLANHLGVPFVQEVIAVSTSLQKIAPQTDVAIELGGEDAKIIYFEGGNIEQRMNGICAGGTGSFIDQMASLLQTDATGLNEYAKNYKALYPIAARCGVFAKTDIQPLINEGATKEDLSASIFQAVVNQTISGLACGKPIRGNVAFLGGPLHFLTELKQAFIALIYALPHEEELQIRYIHKVMLQAEMMLNDTYGMTEKLQKQFRNYYSNMESLTAAQAVDVSYKILGEAIEEREKYAESGENKCAKEYMTVALSYIGEHLQEEELSIVQVATQIYLNPVYFGRVFKNTFHMTFKKYLLQQRMEKAKRLIQDGCESIGTVCEQVGISNASYFSHLFKEYTGKLPSEYKKDYEE